MSTVPKRAEIDHRTTKLIVGVVALSLAGLTSAFAKDAIDSISASYYQGGWSQAVFIGFLFAIAAFLLSYNGLTPSEMVLSKVAAIAALGVALFPCECKPHAALVPYVHGLSASVMFLILTYFCYAFYGRARDKHYPQADVRAAIYAICGLTIALSIAVLALDHFLGGAFSRAVPRLVFYGEAVGLIAFGISWLTASRTLPLITRKEERFSPMKAVNPD
ncbi:hypothetical protein SAMN05518845_11666 [Variovorax sp. YR750]|uniref:hypothetical protein n=1 Tax=Variovorax sp. YR750 TaxID=1884384 RepID=UPI0008C3179B|nr:hypothetical protein [Variovorax sp. YR750]SEM10045.1 hypothetical protein SAMN05518845_11666 [Variovorax sp. YR750]